MSRTQIAEVLGWNPIKVSLRLKKPLKYGEIKCIELDRHQAGKFIGMKHSFRRMRVYYV